MGVRAIVSSDASSDRSEREQSLHPRSGLLISVIRFCLQTVGAAEERHIALETIAGGRMVLEHWSQVVTHRLLVVQLLDHLRTQ